MTDTNKFEAEVIKVEVKKVVSGDRIYRIILETDQEQAVELQKYIANSTIMVEVRGAG